MMQHDDSDSIQIVPDPDRLDRYHRQQLSAMLDGELSPDQARFMLRRLQHDTGLADCWERWQVCGDTLRGQGNALLPADFSQKVSAAIAADGVQVPEARPRAGGPRLLRWGGGAALAASVAMAALLVGRQAGIEPDQAPLPVFPELAASGESAAAPQAPLAIDPTPEPSPAVDTAAVLAGAALAAAEAPRRVAERRGRGQAQGAVAVEASQPVAVAAAEPASGPGRPPETDTAVPTPSGPEETRALFADLPAARAGIGADPFEALPMTVDSRPWPHAATAATGGYAVGLGNATPAAPAWPVQSGPSRQAVAELFGLPPEAGPRLPVATAIGALAVGADDAPPAAPVVLHPGPR